MPASTPSRRATSRAVSSASSSSTGDRLVDQRAVEHRRDEAGADALDLVRARAAARQHRRGGRLDGDDPAARVALLQEAPRAGQRAAGADAGDEAVDALLHRRPDLRPGGAVVGLGVGGVGELVGQPDVVVARERLRGGDRLVHAAERLRDVHLGAVEPQQPLALAAHALRQREDQVVALGGADERERDARVAARRLDDRRAARLDPALRLGRLDHRDADAVLDRPARVEHLELGEHLGGVALGQQPRELHHRRGADVVGDVDRDCAHPALQPIDGQPSAPASARANRSGSSSPVVRKTSGSSSTSNHQWRTTAPGSRRSESSTAVSRRVERHAPAAGGLAHGRPSPAPPRSTYSAPPASAAIRGRPSTPVIAAAASGSGTSASAPRTASTATGRRRLDGQCRCTQSSVSRAARSGVHPRLRLPSNGDPAGLRR